MLCQKLLRNSLDNPNMPIRPSALRRTWVFGTGGEHIADLVVDSNADVVIIDLERYTQGLLRETAKELFPAAMEASRELNRVMGFRIRKMGEGGDLDLEASMPVQPDIIALPMCERDEHVIELDSALSAWEKRLGIDIGKTELVPLIATPLGLANLRSLATASNRIKSAVLVGGDLTNGSLGEDVPDGRRRDYGRRRFLLECRAAKIEPVDVSTIDFLDRDEAVEEARGALRLGFRSKVLANSLHAKAVNAVFSPDSAALARAVETIARPKNAPCSSLERSSPPPQVEMLERRAAQQILERGRKLKEIEWD